MVAVSARYRRPRSAHRLRQVHALAPDDRLARRHEDRAVVARRADLERRRRWRSARPWRRSRSRSPAARSGSSRAGSRACAAARSGAAACAAAAPARSIRPKWPRKSQRHLDREFGTSACLKCWPHSTTSAAPGAVGAGRARRAGSAACPSPGRPASPGARAGRGSAPRHRGIALERRIDPERHHVLAGRVDVEDVVGRGHRRAHLAGAAQLEAVFAAVEPGRRPDAVEVVRDLPAVERLRRCRRSRRRRRWRSSASACRSSAARRCRAGGTRRPCRRTRCRGSGALIITCGPGLPDSKRCT